MRRMRLVGIAYRRPLAAWIDTDPPEVGCIEITAEHFFDATDQHIRAIASRRPVFLHGLGMSLGTPGPLDRQTLDRFVRVARAANPQWISEHVAFTRAAEIDLGHLNPVVPNRAALDTIAAHAIELAQACGKPLILENITSHLALAGDLSETEFLNRLCERADCGLLLDVTNLYINARNHGFDPRRWLRELDPSRIVQLHLVGYAHHDGAWHDSHGAPVQDDLLELAQEVVAHAPDTKAVIVERDEHFPPPAEMAAELRRLEAALGH
jgi:uncharacterized protein (UPF0276 family)